MIIELFDVDFFSTTGGGGANVTGTDAGESIKSGSFTEFTRKVSSTWYYSLRNCVAVFLFVMLIYTGFRIVFVRSYEIFFSYRLFFD